MRPLRPAPLFDNAAGSDRWACPILTRRHDDEPLDAAFPDYIPLPEVRPLHCVLSVRLNSLFTGPHESGFPSNIS